MASRASGRNHTWRAARLRGGASRLACPRRRRSAPGERGNMSGKRKLLIAGAAVAALLVVFFTVVFVRLRREVARIQAVELAEHDLSKIADGAYRGTETFGSVFEVEVTVKDHRIARVEMLRDDGRKYARKAAAILEAVALEQWLEVDAVSGATVTSKVLLNAVNDALLRARRLGGREVRGRRSPGAGSCFAGVAGGGGREEPRPPRAHLRGPVARGAWQECADAPPRGDVAGA